MKKLLLCLSLFLLSCSTPRSGSIFGIAYPDQPPRAFIRAQCNGINFTTQGIMVCEQKQPSQAVVSVKVPPLQGRVVYSNGQLKSVDDFNWYPKTGFWIWKKVPINDTWVPLDLGEIEATFGDWPVALDIYGLASIGVINTRGVMYYRVCDDKTIACSHLVVDFMCQGETAQTNDLKIGKCGRMSGSAQGFSVELKANNYAATTGGKLYVSSPGSSYNQTFTLAPTDIAAGTFNFSIPNVVAGPNLVGFRLAYYDTTGTLQTIETRVLLMGTNPSWTGIDLPHYMDNGNGTVKFVSPILSDELEVNRYDVNGQLLNKQYSGNGNIDVTKATAGQTNCAFAWQRDSSDLTGVCTDSNLNEVNVK